MNKLSTEDLGHIQKIKQLLLDKFGDLILSIYCYGSRITRNISDTDFDILILTNRKIDWVCEYEISQIIVRYGIHNDIVFDPQIMFIDEFEIKYAKYPYIQNIKAVNVVV